MGDNAELEALFEQAREQSESAAPVVPSQLDKLQAGAAKLAAQWERVYSGAADVAEFRRTADQTREFLATVATGL